MAKRATRWGLSSRAVVVAVAFAVGILVVHRQSLDSHRGTAAQEIARSTTHSTTEIDVALPVPTGSDVPVADSGENTVPRVFAIPTAVVGVHFPDGDIVEVTIRRVPALRPIEDGALDADSAFARSRRAERCLTLLHSNDATAPGTSDCVGDLRHHAGERERWLRLAAAGGNVHAVRISAMGAAEDAEGIEVLERAWLAGFIPPLERMANIYFSQPALGDERPSNRARGLAYMWLQAHLQDVAAGTGRRGYVAGLYETLASRQAEMELAEMEDALQLAKDLLKRNERCCFGP